MDEIAEAQLTAKLKRLSTRKAGRRIQGGLSLGYHGQQGPKQTMTNEIRRGIILDPISKTIRPEYNRGRRKAQAKTMTYNHGSDQTARFVVVADREMGERFAFAVLNANRTTGPAASVKCHNAEEAIALALMNPFYGTVLSE